MKNRVLLTYDVFKNHEQIKQQLLDKGWKDSIKGVDSNGKDSISYLPNTSFWHEDITAQEARDMFRILAGDSNIERMMCYEWVTWSGMKGEPHADNKTAVNR
jgi:hypothetical protein